MGFSPAIQQLRVFAGSTIGKEPTYQCRKHKRCSFDLWVGKIPWRRAWQPNPAFFPRESHGHRSLVGYSLWGCRVNMIKTTWPSSYTATTFTHTLTFMFFLGFLSCTLHSAEKGALRHTVGPCGFFYKQWCIYVNLSQLISPCPPTSFLGNHKLLFFFFFLNLWGCFSLEKKFICIHFQILPRSDIIWYLVFPCLSSSLSLIISALVSVAANGSITSFLMAE